MQPERLSIKDHAGVVRWQLMPQLSQLLPKKKEKRKPNAEEGQSVIEINFKM